MQRTTIKSMLNEIPKDIKLDGSAPIHSSTVTFNHPPIRRIKSSIDIPAIANRRGVFLVDMIGNGVTTRALIRKGELRYIADQEK
eukprot:UN19736